MLFTFRKPTETKTRWHPLRQEIFRINFAILYTVSERLKHIHCKLLNVLNPLESILKSDDETK